MYGDAVGTMLPRDESLRKRIDQAVFPSMDSNTEPLIAVIGYPIADNPAEFALDRVFAAMGLDWRVISFEIPTRRLGAALDGTVALGFRGVLIDRAQSELAARWYRQRYLPPGAPDPPARVDCFSRAAGPSLDADPPPEADDLWETWLREQVRRHFESRGRRPANCLRLPTRGSDRPLPVAESLSPVRYRGCPEPEQLAEADIIVVEAPLSRDQAALVWPADDASTLVIELADDAVTPAARFGYRVITADAIRAGVLGLAVRRWTGRDADAEIIRDAIEEYGSV